MRNSTYVLIIFIVSLVFITACVKTYSMDESRQIAVSELLKSDKFQESNGFNLSEENAQALECSGCYYFQYKYFVDETNDFRGYITDTYITNDKIENITYTKFYENKTIHCENNLLEECPSTCMVCKVCKNCETLSCKSTKACAIQDLPPIEDRFDITCKNKCGNGICDDSLCSGTNCTCEESSNNCPEDC